MKKYRIILLPLVCLFLMQAEIELKVPNLSNDVVVSCFAGLRPYRKSGIRLEVEKLDNKLIVHNYGHGGSGISLSWGCAQEALRLMKSYNSDDKKTSVAILGSGSIGLTMAHVLADEGYSVKVYAREFVPFTTSNKAAGIFSPNFSLGNMSRDLFLKIKYESYRRFYEFATTHPAQYEGVFLLPSYAESNKFTIHDNLPKNYHVVSFGGLKKVCKKKFSIVFDCTIYLQDLFDKAKSKGVLFEHRDFTTIEDVKKVSETVIFNCTGLGSRDLFNDQDLIPVKGHLIALLHQPEIDYVVSKWHQEKDVFFSIIPWKNQLVLGGTMEEGVEDPSIDQEIIDGLMSRARSFFAIESTV